jgi:hypothetical protein
MCLPDKVLKALDSFGAVLVAASHNNYLESAEIRNRLDGWPSRFGVPGEESQPLKNLIVVSGIDQNSVVSPLNPYASWLAMAPGYKVTVAGLGGGFDIQDGASLGK